MQGRLEAFAGELLDKGLGRRPDGGDGSQDGASRRRKRHRALREQAAGVDRSRGRGLRPYGLEGRERVTRAAAWSASSAGADSERPRMSRITEPSAAAGNGPSVITTASPAPSDPATSKRPRSGSPLRSVLTIRTPSGRRRAAYATTAALAGSNHCQSSTATSTGPRRARISSSACKPRATATGSTTAASPPSMRSAPANAARRGAGRTSGRSPRGRRRSASAA